MAINFREGVNAIIGSDSSRIVMIDNNGSGVFVDDYIEYEELEQILNKMKKLREEKKCLI